MHDRLTRRAALKGMLSTGTLALARPASSLLPAAGLPEHPGDLEISLFSVSPRTVRITVQPVRDSELLPVPSDGALADHSVQAPAARMRGLTGSRTVKCGQLRVTVAGDPLSFRVEGPAGKLVQRLTLDSATSELRFDTGNGTLLGLGQGGPQFDRRGDADRMVSGQGGYHLGTHGARVPIQFLIGTDGWAMFVHAPLGAFDLNGKEGRLSAANSDALLPLDVFVIAAAEPAAVLREFAEITGYAEMPPLWSLGYQQSHRTLDAPEAILAEARTFREKKLPCDAMIYLGTGFCPNGWNTDNGEFTWNARAFPDPPQAIAQLHDEHFKVVLHVVLEGEQLTGTVHDPCTAAPLPTGRTPDHHWPPDRQVACYWPAHRPLAELGVDGWWPDQGDGLDAPSRLARNRMYFEGQQLYRPNQRVYALHRNAYAGMQRYAAFLWSGDVLSRWETLKIHVPNAVNTSLSGIPYWGTDIGGFVPTDEFTGELYARWFQFAAFCPLFRSHGRDWKLHLPWGWNTGEIGYPETKGYNPAPAELHNPAIEPVCRKYLELRYRLMPYLYSAVRETCHTGLPVIRAMWLHYPDDPAAVARGDQYLYGRDLLVAPVVEKGATSRTLYLPRGIWYDYWTNERHNGGSEITRDVDLATIPLYVRAGACIPTGPLRQYTAEHVDEPMTITVFPGADGSSFLYQDDGETFNFRKGEFTHVEMRWDDASRHLTLHLANGSRMLQPAGIALKIGVAGSDTWKSVTFHGHPLSVAL
ncbi:MAG: TIM-barrel domain-containing protein [Acidobacteriaceae bacterium]